MRLKGATFDWWGTIAAIPSKAEGDAMRDLRVVRLEEALRRLEIAVDRSALLRAYDRQGEMLEQAWALNREPSPEQQVHAFLRFARIDSRDARVPSAIGEAIGGAILVRLPSLFPHVGETLDALRAKGLAIGLISNTGRSWGRYLTKVQEALGIGAPFAVRVYSDELRVRKPNRRMFDTALAGLRLRAAEVVHIGDGVDADVNGAKAAGMRAVWFNGGQSADAKADRADAEVRRHQELPGALEAMA